MGDQRDSAAPDTGIHPTGWLGALLEASIWRSRVVRWFIALLALSGLILVISTPFGLLDQTLLTVVMLVAALVINRLSQDRLTTLVLISLSCVASLRYMYWRITSTLGFENAWDTFFGYGLLLAEIYALMVLLLSYFQCVWPLRRQPVLMATPTDEWPTVDVYIPTFNEPLSVVRPTILTSLSLDWPAEKLRIYVLDDGRRDEFRAYCEEVGVGYITRDNNRHAKAGNLNHAMTLTDGEYIAIFDCDHIPTRSFLQISMGWFMRDPQLAMLQTPHVFFSPDPLEKNLDTFHDVPNEGQLFYGLTQDGNDLWNAAFFCGSCAVLRRSALDDIDGIATESVTEDALTALKLNEVGYNTAYLALPQAAGLATENLSRHIGQRIRWARGMTQILRRYNPLLRRGLNLAQRICYSSAVLHFFYGLPRLVFLTGSLAYLFFGARVFQASALMVAAYVIPHIMLAYITNNRVQGRFRHSFWNDVYETVLAWYIFRPTLSTLLFPDRATFTVTAKGATTHEGYFDWVLARPYIILLLLNVAGVISGLVQMALHWDDTTLVLTVILNLVWTVHNVVVVSASVAVAGEKSQLRSTPRVDAHYPATLRLPTGHRLSCTLINFSQDGLGLKTNSPLSLQPGEQVRFTLFRDGIEAEFPATVAAVHGQRLGLKLEHLTLEQQVEFARFTFARADIWSTTWHETRPDSPLAAIQQVSRIGLHGVRLLATESWRELMSRIRSKTPTSAAATKQEAA